LAFFYSGGFVSTLWEGDKYINHLIHVDNMESKEGKTKVELDTELVEELIKRKKVGMSYNDVIKELLRGDE
jgi:hypothetical protein